MLWIALDFPCLPLDTFALPSAHTEPWAIADGTNVLVCNSAAQALGVRNGMRLSAACALSPQLNYRVRDEAAEAATLATLAAWANVHAQRLRWNRRARCCSISKAARAASAASAHPADIAAELDDMGYAATMACAYRDGGLTARARRHAENRQLQARAKGRRTRRCRPTAMRKRRRCCRRSASSAWPNSGVAARRVAPRRPGIARYRRPRAGTPRRASLSRPRNLTRLELRPRSHTAKRLFAARRLINQLTGFPGGA
jgi:hypothetical protein